MQGEGDATGRREEELKRLVRLRRRRRRRRGSGRTPAPDIEDSKLLRRGRATAVALGQRFLPSRREGMKQYISLKPRKRPFLE